jgi:hypothetical protein
MNRLYQIPELFILFFLATVLCGCPPLEHKIFVRNTTLDTARITLIYKIHFDSIPNRNISARAVNEILPIRKKSLSRLSDTILATVEQEKVSMIIAPKSTVLISDILKSSYIFADNLLVIEYAGKSDTSIADYPYKRLRGFRKKFDPSYNYFYRTLVYYDIK